MGLWEQENSGPKLGGDSTRRRCPSMAAPWGDKITPGFWKEQKNPTKNQNPTIQTTTKSDVIMDLMPILTTPERAHASPTQETRIS